jgi:cytochrome P450
MDGMEKQTRLREELLDPENDAWRSDYNKLNQLPYLDAVTKEVMRLFAPVRFTRRRANQDGFIPLSEPLVLRDGSTTKVIQISEGDDIIIQLWRMNIDPNVWGDDALVFRPERWLQEGHEYFDGGLPLSARKNHGWSHLTTFTVGPRNCIGMHFAIAEFKVLVAHTLSNYELRPMELPGEEAVEIDWRNIVVTRPHRKDNPGKLDMPCRLHRLAPQ